MFFFFLEPVLIYNWLLLVNKMSKNDKYFQIDRRNYRF